MTPAEELRAAATLLRTPLPPYLAGAQVRVIQGDSERMDTLAWCRVTDHGDDGDGECENCKVVEVLQPVLARLIAALFTAREPLARLLDDAADRLGFFASLGERALPLAEYELAVARALLGTTR
ncbi:hypothetical protein GCM10017673_14570 [Streptosporangium violaceochromogenes]|nr:hypothetical protein GCM10017673_14570 [Streptosporangium violaceochromogenes]